MIKLVHKEQGEGTVCAIDKEKIWVLTGGGSCVAEKKSCNVGCGACSTRKPERKFSVALKNPDAYTVGEKISFCRFIPEPNLAGFLIFGTPILLAMITMLCWILTASQKVESPAALLSTAAAFFGGFFILMIIDTLFKKRYPAAITDDKYNEH